ncbi:ArsR family transcriptional regulator [Mesorhizobium sp. M7A.F.Ca.US.001.01.1.1]|nr:ArsR family transcriptional regulator [Mesorhizobium sp. M7A.F.Ca.US.001.01.1.1]
MVSDGLRANAARAAEFLEVLGNARRLHILSLLLDYELPDRKIRERLNISRTASWHHIAKLREVGLVKIRRDGRNVYFSSENRAVRDLLCKWNVVVAVQQSGQAVPPGGGALAVTCQDLVHSAPGLENRVCQSASESRRDE